MLVMCSSQIHAGYEQVGQNANDIFVRGTNELPLVTNDTFGFCRVYSRLARLCPPRVTFCHTGVALHMTGYLEDTVANSFNVTGVERKSMT